MSYYYDTPEPSEFYTCLDCGWEGYEEELVIDEYDSYNTSSPIACCCPVCGGEDLS